MLIGKSMLARKGLVSSFRVVSLSVFGTLCEQSGQIPELASWQLADVARFSKEKALV